jgi:NADH-quinone oxidoreductase subunit D
MTMSFQAREQIMLFFESVSGLRMNNEFFRIGGVDNDVPNTALDELEKNIKHIIRGINEFDKLLSGNPIWKARSKGIGKLSLSDCISYGVTGPVLRSAGSNKDLRKTNPYLDYETYDFDVAITDTADSWGRYLIRLEEMRQSLKIVKECIKRLRDYKQGDYFIKDLPISPTYKLSIGSDGQGQSPENVEKLGYDYETVKKKDNQSYSSAGSMEHLINHFKYMTDGFTVPVGTAFQMVECARGIVACTVISTGKNKPYRTHFTDASFTNLQALKKMCIGEYLSDIVVSLASLDPVLGSVDR